MGGNFNQLVLLSEEAVRRRTVPGLVVAAATAGNSFVRGFGFQSVDPDAEPATPDTSYDLASLTKALATSLLVLRAVSDGKVELASPVQAWVPEFRGDGKHRVSIRDLLAHASGLPAHRAFFLTALSPGLAPSQASRAQLQTLAAEEPLVYERGTQSIYTDLGFIILGTLLERVFARRLDALARDLVFAPLGIEGLAFRPLDGRDESAAMPRPAPTERCAARGRMIEGEVHDLNAWAMLGVAGHAGLFGHARAVASLAQALCTGWATPSATSSRAIDGALLRRFWSPAGVPASTWRLGWDGPATQQSLAGNRLARTGVGHLGFTGCSLWIDPARAAYVAVLTNRVHPKVPDGDAARTFRVLRPALNDAALEAVGYPEGGA